MQEKIDLENGEDRQEQKAENVCPVCSTVTSNFYKRLDGKKTCFDCYMKLLKPIVSKQNKIGRNEKCPCMSGKKYKHCCLLTKK
ncbi:MAG: SEC-C metal-binding domain-containing protein [Phenylobacterium sp.]